MVKSSLVSIIILVRAVSSQPVCESSCSADSSKTKDAVLIQRHGRASTSTFHAHNGEGQTLASDPALAPDPAPILLQANPTTPGCYFKQPQSSSKCGGPFLDWARDVWGEEHAESGASESKCLERKSGHDDYCSVTTEWMFVAAEPTAEEDGWCCSTCGGTYPFCSPQSGTCYGSKRRDYYLGCTTTTTTPCVGSRCKIIKVMSYNTEYRNYNSRMGGYAAKIKEVSPAIVGLQECQNRDGLAGLSGYTANTETGHQNYMLFDPSKVTLMSGGSMRIPRDDYAERFITWGQFKFNDDVIWFFNTHLPHNHNEARSQTTHARIAKLLLDKRKDLGVEHAPTIVVGDMNSHASSFNKVAGGGFESNLQANGFTLAYTARGSNGGYGGIDHILYSTANWSHNDCADTGTGGSDHTSITCDLALKPPGWTCCDDCGDKPFCSPASGSCYDSKFKDYYLSCEVDAPVTTLPPVQEPPQMDVSVTTTPLVAQPPDVDLPVTTIPPVSEPPQGGDCYGELSALATDEGREIDHVYTEDVAECKQACSGNNQCQSVSFCPQWSGCWLKDRTFTGGESTRTQGDCKTYYKMHCEDMTTTTPCVGPNCDGACCSACGGASPFCSPDSGSCYASKAKDYYLGCSTTTTTPWSGIPTCTESGECPIKVISLNLADGQGVSSSAIAPTVGGQMPFDLGGFQEPRGWSENMDFKDSDTLDWYQSDTKKWPRTNPAPIAWNKNRFHALNRGSYAEVARDGCGARVLEFVNLVDMSTGKKVFFANTHGPVSSVCGGGSSGWEYDKNMAETILREKADSEVVIVTGDFNTGPGTLTRTREIVFNKVEGSWNIDMILSNVPCDGGSFDGGRSDHDGVKATCDFFREFESCCDDCGGKPFCSPNSGSCYDSKLKNYYLSCEVDVQPTTKPPLAEPPKGGDCYGELFALATDEGVELDYVRTDDVAVCEQSCTGNSQCQSVSFCPQWSGCWLKDRAFTGGEPTRRLADCKTYYKMSCL